MQLLSRLADRVKAPSVYLLTQSYKDHLLTQVYRDISKEKRAKKGKSTEKELCERFVDHCYEILIEQEQAMLALAGIDYVTYRYRPYLHGDYLYYSTGCLDYATNNSELVGSYMYYNGRTKYDNLLIRAISNTSRTTFRAPNDRFGDLRKVRIQSGRELVLLAKYMDNNKPNKALEQTYATIP